MRERVVITGYGIINALGNNKNIVEEKLFSGVSGLGNKQFGTINNSVNGTVGEVKDYHEQHDLFKKYNIPYDKCISFALSAAHEAVEMAKCDFSNVNPYRIGTAVGTSLGGMLSGQEFHRQWLENGISEADEKYLIAYPLHAVADLIALEFGNKGLKAVISTACAASGNIIGYAADMIANGKCDFMITGGVDPLSSFSFAGFHSLKALDSEPCKPYSNSSGINLGEGAAFFVLESLSHARKRNAAHIYAEVLGYGLSADAYHPTAPDLGGGGAARAMEAGILDGKIEKKRVSYVNGHGTGTVANDRAEKLACKKVFGEDIVNVPVSSIKAAIGHCLGAAGAQEAAACVMALNNHLIPPTINFQTGIQQSEFNFVPNKSQDYDCDIILSNSFAFGGSNCCLVLGNEQKERQCASKISEKIVITGIGCCGSGGINPEELWDTFSKRKSYIQKKSLKDKVGFNVGTMPEIDWKKYIPGKFLRRIDDITKMTMTVGKQALVSAGVKVTRDNMEKIGVIYGTATGPMNTIVSIDKSIVETGIDSVSLSDFPNSVINAAPGNFCIANMIKGPTSTLSSGDCSFMLAFSYALEMLENDRVEMMIVISADECTSEMLEGGGKLGLLSKKTFLPLTGNEDGKALASGAVAVVIEKESHALKRGAKIYAKVDTYSSYSGNDLPIKQTSSNELIECIQKTVKDSNIEHVDLYVCSGMGVKEADIVDENAIKQLIERGVFDEKTAYSSSSPLLGSTQGSSSGYNLLNALYSFEKQEVIGMPNTISSVHESFGGKYPLGKNQKKEIH